MGADGYLMNLKQSKQVELICYMCGKPVNLFDPLHGHEKCVEECNGEDVLFVNLEIDDYESR